MVFWTLYPHFFISSDRFSPHLIKKQRLPSPTDSSSELVQSALVLQEVQQFLLIHFGSPPRTPVFDISLEDLLGPMDHIMIIRHGELLVGCIRYHYLGKLTTSKEEIYCVDCFCIHPQWRKRGVGDYLLTELHFYGNAHNIPYSLFLKEGSSLPILHSPLYKGEYTYRTMMHPMQSRWICCLSMERAHRLLALHQKFQPDLFIIQNSNENQQWRLYKRRQYHVLACVQDTFQKREGAKMAWITAWIESPGLTDAFRMEAANAIAHSVYPEFESIWANRQWAPTWTKDGGFQWYAYQWTTSIPLRQSYAILT